VLTGPQAKSLLLTLLIIALLDAELYGTILEAEVQLSELWLWNLRQAVTKTLVLVTELVGTVQRQQTTPFLAYVQGTAQLLPST
jgi:hypothetical protein